MRSKPRGFTLLEGLFSLFIVLLVLSGLSHMLSQAAQVKKNTKNMDQAVEEFHALNLIQTDLQSALTITNPSPGGSSARLVLTRINPRLLFVDRIDSEGDPLDPYEPDEQVRVEYYLEEGVLFRSLREGDVTTAERLVKAGRFEVALTSNQPRVLTLEIDIEGLRVTKTRLLKVALNR